jgi:GxxExxY protein
MVPVIYREGRLENTGWDLIVEDLVVVEIKSVERFDPIFEAQVLTTKSYRQESWTLINFNSRL